MENKFFVCSDTYFIKDKVHPKNIRYVYLNTKTSDKPTTNLDFDVELDSDFYKYIRYYRLVMDGETPQALYEAGGEKIGTCEDWYDFQELMKQVDHNYYFTRNHRDDSQFYKSVAEAGIGVQEWIRKVAKLAAEEAIIDNIENYED